jgi:serine phosphatase RsbU (regulator of sigma subunit)
LFQVQVAVAKIHRYADRESGDTVEIVERPHGGISVVLCDGQGSGRGAKTISNLVTTKAVSLLKDGVRDGAVARAAHDYLYAYRHGQVSATLDILSVDLVTRTIVVSRNSLCPAIVARDGQLTYLDQDSSPIGLYPRTKPAVSEIELDPSVHVIIFSDGVLNAGRRYGQSLDLEVVVGGLLGEPERGAQVIADGLLSEAMRLDQGRPNDDMSVLTLAVLPRDEESAIRTMLLNVPLD